MTHPTLEEKTKIKEAVWLSEATLEMILQIIHEFKVTFHKKQVERITNPQRKRRANDKLIHKHTRNSSARSNFTE